MTLEFSWTQQDILDAEEEFGSEVAENLEAKLDKRESETQYYSNLNGFRKRFHNTFKMTPELMIYELRFSAASQEWRGICIEIEERSQIIYFDLCSKKNQDKFLDYMKNNSGIILESIQKSI